MVWEVKPGGLTDCESGMQCLPPNVCWWPSEFSQPSICAPPGYDMNTFTARISIDQAFAWLLSAALIGLGLLGSVALFALIGLCRRCFRAVQPGVGNGQVDNDNIPAFRRQWTRLSGRLRRFHHLRHQQAGNPDVPVAPSDSVHIPLPQSVIPSGFSEIPLIQRPCSSRSVRADPVSHARDAWV